MSISQAIAQFEVQNPSFHPWKIDGHLYGGISIGRRTLWWTRLLNGSIAWTWSLTKHQRQWMKVYGD